MKKPIVEIYRSKSGKQKGQWRFRVYASNGKILCQSEGYTSKQKAEKGIAALARRLDETFSDFPETVSVLP